MAELDIRGTRVLVDDQDVTVVLEYNWRITHDGYVCTDVKRENGTWRKVGMHRIILNDPPSQSVDHINRDKLDNRRSNLRACSTAENCRNIPTRKRKSSKHRGVSKCSNGRWQVVLRINGKLKWCGVFDTEKEAAKVAAPHFAGIAP